jgi:hypothetical protein
MSRRMRSTVIVISGKYYRKYQSTDLKSMLYLGAVLAFFVLTPILIELLFGFDALFAYPIFLMLLILIGLFLKSSISRGGFGKTGMAFGGGAGG